MLGLRFLQTSLLLPLHRGGNTACRAAKFTPEQVRKDDTIPWKTAKLFYGGKRRRIRYKEVPQVLWQGGAKRRPLRLFIIAPTPYRKRQSSRLYYRDPAYLLTTVLHGQAHALLQIYFDRWQIELNHREEKDTVGVGQAQLWNPVSVPKQPAFAVAAYNALLLAGLEAFEPRVDRPSRNFPSGAAKQRGLPAWIWSPSCDSKWPNTPKCSHPSA